MNKTVTKINITKSLFLEKIKYINLYPESSRKKERTQINNIRNEKGEIILDTIEIQRTIRDCQKQLYANKIDNLEEKDNFPRLNQEELENINRPITSNQIETVIKNLLRPDGFTGKFYQIFRKHLMPILKPPQKNAEGGTLPNLLYEATITLISKSDKDITKKIVHQYH